MGSQFESQRWAHRRHWPVWTLAWIRNTCQRNRIRWCRFVMWCASLLVRYKEFYTWCYNWPLFLYGNPCQPHLLLPLRNPAKKQQLKNLCHGFHSSGITFKDQKDNFFLLWIQLKRSWSQNPLGKRFGFFYRTRFFFVISSFFFGILQNITLLTIHHRTQLQYVTYNNLLRTHY